MDATGRMAIDIHVFNFTSQFFKYMYFNSNKEILVLKILIQSFLLMSKEVCIINFNINIYIKKYYQTVDVFLSIM